MERQKQNNESRILIFEIPDGGLGDIFEGLLSMYQIARVSDRSFFFKTIQGFDMSAIFEPRCLFEFSIDLQERIYHYKNVPVIRRIKRPQESEQGYILRSLKESLKREEPIVRIQGMCPLRSEEINAMYLTNFQVPMKPFRDENRDVDVQRLLIRNVFPIRKHFLETYAESSRTLGLENIDYVSVHARIGKGVNESHVPRFKYTSDNLETIAKCLSYLANIKGKSMDIDVIFLASDTPEFELAFRKQLKLLSNTMKVVVPNWPHTGHLRKIDVSEEELTKRTVLTMTELQILGHGNHIINLISGFADLSVLLGSVPSQSVIDPDYCRAF